MGSFFYLWGAERVLKGELDIKGQCVLTLIGMKCSALIFVSVLVNGTCMSRMTLAFAHAVPLMR